MNDKITYDCGCEFIVDTHMSIRIISHTFCSKHVNEIYSKRNAD